VRWFDRTADRGAVRSRRLGGVPSLVCERHSRSGQTSCCFLGLSAAAALRRLAQREALQEAKARRGCTAAV